VYCITKDQNTTKEAVHPKSKRELMEFAMPGVNLLSAMGKKN